MSAAPGRCRVGVLGGMGPRATAVFLDRLVEYDPATGEQDRLSIALWNDPSVPDRTDALIRGGPSPVPALASGLRWLTEAGVELVAMPCNTAHSFLTQLRGLSDVPILDMVHVAMQDCAALDGVHRVGVLATRGTRAARLYDVAARSVGLDLLHVDEWSQDNLVDAAIAALKSGNTMVDASALVAAAIRNCFAGQVDVVVAGCTELSLVVGLTEHGVPVVDATDSLTQEVHRRLAAPPASV